MHGIPKVHYKGRQGDYYIMVSKGCPALKRLRCAPHVPCLDMWLSHCSWPGLLLRAPTAHTLLLAASGHGLSFPGRADRDASLCDDICCVLCCAVI